jgi:hypothetical protein
MKRISRKGILYIALISAAVNTMLAGVAVSAQGYSAPILQLQPPNYNVDCVWFSLVGVAQADPINPGSPWFGLPRTQTGYSEMFAVLLAAKLSGATLSVVTTGSAAGGGCGGYAGIAYVIMQ